MAGARLHWRYPRDNPLIKPLRHSEGTPSPIWKKVRCRQPDEHASKCEEGSESNSFSHAVQHIAQFTMLPDELSPENTSFAKMARAAILARFQKVVDSERPDTTGFVPHAATGIYLMYMP